MLSYSPEPHLQPFFFPNQFFHTELKLKEFRKGERSLLLCYLGFRYCCPASLYSTFHLLLQSKMGGERENCIHFSPGEGEREVIKGSGSLKLLYGRDKAG